MDGEHDTRAGKSLTPWRRPLMVEHRSAAVRGGTSAAQAAELQANQTVLLRSGATKNPGIYQGKRNTGILPFAQRQNDRLPNCLLKKQESMALQRKC